MFGYLRFILAIMVVLSHLQIKVNGLNIGVIAVVIFYILAGFVVSYLYVEIIPNQVKNKKDIYKLFLFDRVKRIFPLYLFIILLTTLFLLFTNYGNPNFTIFNIITNLTIIPLNYYMLIDNAVLSSSHWWLIPPAWSLGTELQAYIILPFTIIYRRVKYAFILISFLIYILANFSIIHSDYFGYRLIIGVLFIFLLGNSLYKLSSNRSTIFDKIFTLIIWIYSLIFIYLSVEYSNLNIQGFTKETSIGLLIGIPIVYFLSTINLKIPLNRFLGSLSYGLFLSHFLAIWIVEYLQASIPIDAKVVSILIISLTLGIVGVFLEKKIKSVEKMLIK